MAATAAPLLVLPAAKSTATSQAQGKGPALGLYFIGAVVVVSLADTRAAPVVAAFLAAVAIYNGSNLIAKKGG